MCLFSLQLLQQKSWWILSYAFFQSCSWVSVILSLNSLINLFLLKKILWLLISLQKKTIEVPNIPGNEASGTHNVPMESVIYIDSTDFKEVSSVLFWQSFHSSLDSYCHIAKKDFCISCDLFCCFFTLIIDPRTWVRKRIFCISCDLFGWFFTLMIDPRTWVRKSCRTCQKWKFHNSMEMC